MGSNPQIVAPPSSLLWAGAGPGLLPATAPACWYAAYTVTRHEKRVVHLLQERGVECFLPLYEATHLWKNGVRQRLELVLFPSYVFVHVELQNRLPVLQVPGVVNLVSFHGAPAPLPDAEVAALQNALRAGMHAEPYPYLQAGQQVEIARGYLQGMRGTVLRTKNRCRVVLSVDLLLRSIVVDIDASDLSRSVPLPRL